MEHKEISSSQSPYHYSTLDSTSPKEGFSLEVKKASALYANMSSLNAVEKEEMMLHLEGAYLAFRDLQKIDKVAAKDSLSTLTEVFYMYGRGLYGGNMNECSQVLQNALILALIQAEGGLHLHTEHFFDRPSLADYKEGFRDTNGLHKLLDYHLLTTPSENLVRQLNSQDKKATYLYASILRWYGHALQNIDTKNTPKSQNVPRFEKVYGASQELFQEVSKTAHDAELQKDANWEVGQLVYNTGRFMHRLKHPGDDAGAVKTLEEVLPFLEIEQGTVRSQQLRAQIQNILWIEESKDANNASTPEDKKIILEKGFFRISEAAKIADETEGFNPFLHAMFFNNKAATALKCKHKNYEDIQQWVNVATNYAKDRNFDHYYESIYFMTEAKLMQKMGDMEKAFESLETATMICEKYLDSSESILLQVNALKAKFVKYV